jgi:primosomal protein N' (replication factor Y)
VTRLAEESLFGELSKDSESCNHIVRVAVDCGADSLFDYFVPDRLWPILPGQRVLVPFGKGDKHQTAFCVQADIPQQESFLAKTKKHRLKQVFDVPDKQPLLIDSLLSLGQWISDYYVCPLGQVLSAMVPAAVKKGVGVKKQKYCFLADDYQSACEKIKGKKQKLIINLLKEQNAFAPESALNLDTLIEQVSCTNAPLNELARRQVIRIIQRQVLPTLPAIPDKMVIKTDKVTLNDDQDKALESIKQKLDSEKFSVSVLFGVTDSGKTEVYIRAIEAVLKKGKKAIVLLPEIALTAQTVQRFSSRFERVAVMHSALSASQRNAQWQMIKTGQADVVIGARSAIFAPLAGLGLVVVDEEHEPAYKQDSLPRYHGRDVAIKRAQLENALCILGSATPSLETIYNCRTKKNYTLLRLPNRVLNLPSPQMKLVDMREQIHAANQVNLISKSLEQHLRGELENGRQAILLLNRRGYSNIVICSACKYTLQCRNCDVTLTFHKEPHPGKSPFPTITGRHLPGKSVCHHCGAQSLVPTNCPLCGKSMFMLGIGTQRLEEEIAQKFPSARIARVDSDSMAGADYYKLLKNFSDGNIDILAGTQMLAKGLHFPNVTVVGIISADTCLYLPDFRSNERTFQLITQVAGRAGRSEKKGMVFIQTYLPDQPAIKFALAADFEKFINEELKHRKACNLPPFWRLASLLLSDRSFDKLQLASNNLKRSIETIIQQQFLTVIVRGPAPAVISRIQRSHRMQILIQAPDPAVLQKFFNCFRSLAPTKPAVAVAIDIDPVNLL